MNEQLGQGAAGDSEKQHGGGRSTALWSCFVLRVVLVRLWLGLLACLLGWAWYMSLCGGVGWGVVWLGCETGTVLGDTAVPLPGRTWGASHTPDDDLA